MEALFALIASMKNVVMESALSPGARACRTSGSINHVADHPGLDPRLRTVAILTGTGVGSFIDASTIAA